MIACELLSSLKIIYSVIKLLVSSTSAESSKNLNWLVVAIGLLSFRTIGRGDVYCLMPFCFLPGEFECNYAIAELQSARLFGLRFRNSTAMPEVTQD